ncbi:hypothetical protein Kpol_505p26 [Vanderwaltozyma polyspora DSM 70294]|uniref:Uncharacterized protein n=1 Tax=Vanderwaltozyma polyspora (strain ATCC 22028 / DSM 70294 / BCRC 21397 / CBS 2163 / NBRC 10782 / NRRL Y-8283 / UCD 57-17) TaxID=436907 RepID=A7TNB7_VANPO|nr:uncharacterized protein Kpol_505p26 [Vanderwaltozyma polyspora DSM 70294]EDO16249.1 hypothetical protein Kpol_505p26 [Vanderwaltozyma polyspora DSM 70294]
MKLSTATFVLAAATLGTSTKLFPNSTDIISEIEYSEPFFIKFANGTLSDILDYFENNDIVNFVEYEINSGNLPITFGGDTSSIFNINDIESLLSQEFRLSSLGQLLNTANETADNFYGKGYSISGGLLNFKGLNNWTINLNGPNLNINLPGSTFTTTTGLMPVVLSAVTQDGTTLSNFPNTPVSANVKREEPVSNITSSEIQNTTSTVPITTSSFHSYVNSTGFETATSVPSAIQSSISRNHTNGTRPSTISSNFEGFALRNDVSCGSLMGCVAVALLLI